MNDLQIRYFLKAAQRLNFSEAAKELFISQPALSQQITAIENELNMQLFIRDKNKLRLTPTSARSWRPGRIPWPKGSSRAGGI